MFFGHIIKQKLGRFGRFFEDKKIVQKTTVFKTFELKILNEILLTLLLNCTMKNE